jgi:hypothetical protein
MPPSEQAKSRGRVLRIPVLYSGGPGFEYRPGGRWLCLSMLVISLSTSMISGKKNCFRHDDEYDDYDSNNSDQLSTSLIRIPHI